ncbi:MAG: carbohydrate kinase family protein [Nocardioides sp.]|uniref:carbohydrate kinase family protein n=1 Tax=Nocardioides sp. TaxID=35761 RepID=UPI0039E2F9AF
MTSSPYVVVVGGANMDLKARSAAPVVAGTSNPGSTRMSAGGVGRNVAENLARLGSTVHLVAAVGADPIGDTLLGDTAATGVGIGHVRRLEVPTGTYTAILDHDGELGVAVADMTATDALGPDAVRESKDLLSRAALIVLDANLASPTLTAALTVAAASRVPVVLDPVSVPKAARLAGVLAVERPIHTVTPNADELAELTGLPTSRPVEAISAARRLMESGVARVWVRLGPAGSMLVTADSDPVTLSPFPGEVVDVTGAGDAMLAAYCHALLADQPPELAATHGQAAAALTVAVPETVRPDLTADLVAQTLTSIPASSTSASSTKGSR